MIGPRKELPVVVTDGGELIAGRYRLISRLGSGAMGVVWRAHDERLGRTVAVKRLRAPVGLSDPEIETAHGRARREARIAARLQHPHAVAVYDVVEHEGRPCLIMEYVDARSLSQVLADGAVLSQAEAAAIGVQLASALIAAHEAGIVHRDIKPGNILISESGAAKLTDFGISRATGDVTYTATGEMLGTPAYISPEVAQGRPADDASDVFSLGATLYAAVEGAPPFGTGTNVMALLLRIVNGEINEPTQSGSLIDTVMRMLSHDPADRPNIYRVRRELEAVVEETGLVPSVPPAREGEAPAEVAAPAEPPALPATVPAPMPETAPAAEPAPAPVSDAPPRKPRRRSPLIPVAIMTVAALLSVGVIAAITLHGNSSKNTAGSGTTPTATTQATQTTGATHHASTTPTTAATHASSATASTTSAAASSSATLSVTQQLSNAITHYYSLVPGNLDAAWGLMTSSYQQFPAEGETKYKQFWSQYRSVSLSNLVAQAPSTVTVTITYVSKDGSSQQERTKFGLVLQDGIWKINTSSLV
ncbi:MAG TPA: serine/threonine-protein kinase [Actinospica sp.]|nr:serine/threonine-protein kinase [Actinospica sp.]